MMPATAVAQVWKTPQAKALWAGVASHARARLDRPLTSAVGAMLIAAAHAEGWVVAKGGSGAISDALVTDIERHGGRIETGVHVTSVDDPPHSDVLMLDLSPSVAADILGERLPDRVARAYRRFRHGPGAFKVDFAIEGDVPWAAESARAAGTVHLGGGLDEIVAGEMSISRGAMPDRPFVLVGQQYLADPSRSVGTINPLWTCARSQRLHRRRDGGDHRADRTLRTRLPRTDSGNRSALHDGDVGVQPELRRRRHHRRGHLGEAIGVSTPSCVRSVLLWHPGHLPLFRVDPAGGGSARYVRSQRSRPRACTTRPVNARRSVDNQRQHRRNETLEMNEVSPERTTTGASRTGSPRSPSCCWQLR